MVKKVHLTLDEANIVVTVVDDVVVVLIVVVVALLVVANHITFSCGQ